MENWLDDWVDEHSPLPPEKLHALGFLTFAWNHSEYWAAGLFTTVLRLTDERARLIIHDLGDITIWEKTLLAAKSEISDRTLIEDLTHGRRFYEVCRTNRNLYVHAAAAMTGRQSGLALIRVRGPNVFGSEIPDELSDLRRVGNDIRVLNKYLTRLVVRVANFYRDNSLIPIARPPLPEPLWKPPLQASTKQKRRPQSSET